jgi:indole-3-glycerol phosphate synthase
VKDAADVQAARAMGADAVLVGEALMRATDKRAKLAELRGGL